MDKRYIKKSLQAGEMRLFAGTQITIPAGQKLLLDDFKSTLDSILKDQKRITPKLLTGIVSYVKPNATGLEIGFGMIPDPQGEIGKTASETLDEHTIREMESKLAICVKIAANAITRGNEFALTAEEIALYAEDVRSKFEVADDERIAREVAKRARGTLALFELPNGPQEIGGKHNVPTHYPEKHDITLHSCSIVNWPARNQAIISLPKESVYPELASLLKNGKLRVWVSTDSREAFFLKCADLSGISVDIDINLVENLSPRRIEPRVTTIHAHERVLEEARMRIDAVN